MDGSQPYGVWDKVLWSANDEERPQQVQQDQPLPPHLRPARPPAPELSYKVAPSPLMCVCAGEGGGLLANPLYTAATVTRSALGRHRIPPHHPRPCGTSLEYRKTVRHVSRRRMFANGNWKVLEYRETVRCHVPHLHRHRAVSSQFREFGRSRLLKAVSAEYSRFSLLHKSIVLNPTDQLGR